MAISGGIPDKAIDPIDPIDPVDFQDLTKLANSLDLRMEALLREHEQEPLAWCHVVEVM